MNLRRKDDDQAPATPYAVPRTTKTTERLALADLATPGYQRRVDQARVRKIVREFDPLQVNPPTVSFRDFHHWLLDGQHTVAVLLARGILQHDCQVIKGLTYEEEARLYAERNSPRTHRSLSASDNLKALIESADEIALGVVQLAHDLDLYFPFEKGDTSGNDVRLIMAVGNCLGIARTYGLQHLGQTLKIATRAWPTQKRRLHNLILDGLSTFIDRQAGRFAEQRLINKLSTVAPSSLIAEATTLHQLQGIRRNLAMANRIVALYDKNLKDDEKKLGGGY